MVVIEYSHEELRTSAFSNAQYLAMTLAQRATVFRAMLERAEECPGKQMTNRQILDKYFTKTGKPRRREGKANG